MRLLLLLLLSLSGLAFSQETMIRYVHDTKTDTHVEVVSLFSKPSAGGYFPVRVKVANNQKGGHVIRLKFSSSGNYNSGSRTTSEFEINAPAEKITTRDILVPLNPAAETHGSNVYLAVAMSGTMGIQNNTVNAEFSTDQPSVLLSEPLFNLNASKIDSDAVSKFSSGRYSGGGFTSRFSAGQLPDNWLAFSGFDSIVMLDSDWTSMPPGSRNAIVSWVRLGGHLVIHSVTTTTAASLGLPADTSFGKITLRSVPSSLMLDTADLLELLTSRSPLPTRRDSVTNDFEGGWALYQAFGEKPFRYVLFIIVLLIFGVLVGPINLFVFAKSGRRHLLFITTPIISLGASLILIGLIMFQDGFGGDGRRLVLMEVPSEAGENAAFILQEQVSRTGVLTRSTFTLDTPALFSPVPMEDSRWTRFNRSDPNGTFNLQPEGSGARASGDWFQSRSVQGHSLAAVVPTRGRIERVAGSGDLISTFDFPIRTLFLQDDAGNWQRAESIETGKPFKLTPLDASLVKPELDGIQNEFSHRTSMLFERARQRKGHFIAVTGSAPGIATHPGIRWEDTRTIITGGIATP